MQETIGSHNAVLVSNSINEIDRRIYERIVDWRLFSKESVTQVIVSESGKEFDKLESVQEYIAEQDREWVAAPGLTLSPFMREIAGNELSATLRENLQLLEESAGYKVYGEAFVTNKHGAVAAMSGKTTNYFQADEVWWQKARENGLYVEDVTYDKSSEVYSVNISIRIDDQEGNFIGVIKAVLNLREVIEIVSALEEEGLMEKSETTQFELITQKGEIIYSTEFGSSFFNELPEEEKDQAYHLELTEGEPRVGYQIIKEEPEGEVLMAYAFSGGFRDYQGLGWILAVERDTVEVFAPIDELMRLVIASSLIIFGLFLVVGFVLFKIIITDPIEELRDVARKIGSGNLSAQARVRSGDEIGQLARELHKMAINLRMSKEKQAKYARERGRTGML